MTTAYNKLIKKIGELKADGSVDEEAFAGFRNKFEDAICSDLNTSSAITVIYDVLRSDINDVTKLELIKSFDEVLSLDLLKDHGNDKESSVDSELKEYILAKIEERKAAKKEKTLQRQMQSVMNLRQRHTDKGYQRRNYMGNSVRID